MKNNKFKGSSGNAATTYFTKEKNMKKKNRFKFWLIKVLRKLLNKLDPEKTFKVEHTYVPLVTVNASFTMSKYNTLKEEQINEILSRQLGEEIIKYADIQCCEKVDMNMWEEQNIYSATVRVAVDKRG